MEWADKHDIRIPDFSRIQQTTSDLLDSFLGYKNTLARLDLLMANPACFNLSPHDNPVQLDMEALVTERKLLKKLMSKIGLAIDHLNENPIQPLSFQIEDPNFWNRRLMIP